MRVHIHDLSSPDLLFPMISAIIALSELDTTLLTPWVKVGKEGCEVEVWVSVPCLLMRHPEKDISWYPEGGLQ